MRMNCICAHKDHTYTIEFERSSLPEFKTSTYYYTSGRAVQENIRFEAGSISPTIGRANTEAENRMFSCTARPKECDNIFII